ncbi:MAG: hypothetical protein AAGI34_00630 [Pseudomonadota bacterium]
MTPAAHARLRRAAQAARGAAEARLAETLAKARAHRRQAQALRAEAGAAALADRVDAFDHAAEAAWHRRLRTQAEAENAAADTLEAQAEPLRLALGRARAREDLVERLPNGRTNPA